MSVCVLCAQLCPTLCDRMDGSPPGSPVPEISQARILEWVALSFSRGSSPPRDQTRVSWISCISRWILFFFYPMVYTVHGILQARILEWVAFPFSRGSPQPRDRIQVSRTAGGFFTSWATREAQQADSLLLSHLGSSLWGMSVRFMHILTSVGFSFPWLWITLLHGNLWNHLPVDGHVSGLQVLPSFDNAVYIS